LNEGPHKNHFNVVSVVNMSADVAWAITRNTSAFLLKKRGCAKPFSTDPLNLTNKHSQRYTGLVNQKAVGITAGPENKGFTVIVKKAKKGYAPASSKIKVTMKAGARRSLHKLKSMIVKQRYRKDLTQAALRRAAIIIRSQKPLPAKKGTKPAKKAE